ncbi:MAG: J domain-containing protein [Petrotogales bacterium]
MIEDLKIDFTMDLEGAKSFKQVQTLVFNLLQKISYFGNVSNGVVPCSHIWKVLFTEVFIENVKQKDKSFYDLYYFFDDRNKWFRAKENKEKVKKSQTRQDIQEYLEYMGLSKGFTDKQLKRRYRILCLKYHPDKLGGSSEEFNRLQFIRRELEKTLVY